MDCVVCQEPIEQWRVSCGLHPSHSYCLTCFFRRWFAKLLPELDDIHAFSSATHFLDFLTTLNTRLLGGGQNLGTFAHDDSLLCDFDRVPLSCWPLDAPAKCLTKAELWPLLLELTKQLMLPADSSFVDRCLAYFRHLYEVNETMHHDNFEQLRQLIQQQNELRLELQQQRETLVNVHSCLLRLKIHTSTLALDRPHRSHKWDRVVNHLLMLLNGDLDCNSFNVFLDEFAVSPESA